MEKNQTTLDDLNPGLKQILKKDKEISLKVMQFHKLLIHVSSLYCERRRRQFYELNLSDGQPKVSRVTKNLDDLEK